MIDLRNIARQLRLPADQLRLAADLLVQGYQPAFLERYRSDEIGNLPRSVLWPLKLGIEKQLRLNESRQRAMQQLHAGVELDSEAKERLAQAETEVEIDCTMRAFRARRSMQQNADRESDAGKLLEKLIAYSGNSIPDLRAWVQAELGCDEATADASLQNCKRLVSNLIAGDSSIAQKLRQAIQRKAALKVSLIADSKKAEGGENPPAQSTDAAASPDASTSSISTEPSSDSANPSSGSTLVTSTLTDVDPPHTADDSDDAHDDTDLDDSEHLDAGLEDESDDATPEASEEESTSVESAISAEAGVDAGREGLNPLSLSKPSAKGAIAKKGKKKKSKDTKATSKSSAKISPRQRRRRWLISMLQPFNGLNKPLSKLSAYQQLMIGRGRRSQIVSAQLEYDLRALVNIVRDAFVSDKHPLVQWFSQTIEESLTRQVLNKVELEAVTELEEAAQQKLFEVAADPLRAQLEQRPVRGHRILMIDAVGPKSSSVAIIDAKGRVLGTTEIACSAHPQTVTQNVVRLGELVHKYRVTLVGLTNGPARRFLVHTVKELMNQSADSGLRWTMVDRGGAEAYAASRIALQELPEHNRRDRATIWIARRLQDPLLEMVKLDASRLRLGSYQRELPAEPLKKLINDTIADAVCARGIDTLWANVNELMMVPGVGRDQAEQIVRLAGQGKIKSREDILRQVTDWPEHQSRQAIGFLRVFGSPNTLDATAIHPDDYKLAERLVQSAGLTQPPAAPPGWMPPPIIDPSDASKALSATSVTSDPAATESIPSADAPSGELGEVVASEPTEEPSASVDVAATESPIADSSSADNNTSTPETSSELRTDASVDADLAPEYPEDVVITATAEPTLDVEKLARGWQVGRGRLRWIASCLQSPFADVRLSKTPVPLMKAMPSMENLQPQQCVWVVVVAVADFGAFVELGPDCSGLIHISRLSSGFVEDPHQCVQVGDLLQAWVVSNDSKKRRVAMTAISPAQQQAAREQHQHAEGESRQRGPRPPRGGQPQTERQGRGQGNQPAGPNRGRPAGDRPQGDRAGSGSRGQGYQQGNRGGGSGGGQRGDRRGGQRGDRGRGDRQPRESQSIVVTSKKPKEPISQGMKQGTEPLRSFSDLLQFYELKRTDGPGDVPAPAATSTTPQAVPPAIAEPVKEPPAPAIDNPPPPSE